MLCTFLIFINYSLIVQNVDVISVKSNVAAICGDEAVYGTKLLNCALDYMIQACHMVGLT
jgi:hypothetical protein